MSLRQLRYDAGLTTSRLAHRMQIGTRNVLKLEASPVEAMQMATLQRYVHQGLGCELLLCVAVGSQVWVLDDPPEMRVARWNR